MAREAYDVCVIGAGSGGLSVAYAASHMGARVALVERHKMGGDCLNYGCVPSKALLAAGHAAQAMREAGRFGIGAVEPEVAFDKVRDHVRDVIATIEPNDSVERYAGFGVAVAQGQARFTGAAEIDVEGRPIRARRFVVATGSRAVMPPVPGLDGVEALTNETIFDLARRPGHLLVIGGGPIGCEMAQAHRHLGCRVTVLDMGPILPRDDAELTEVLRRRFLAEGIALLERVAVEGVEAREGGVAIRYRAEDGAREVVGTHLLVAAGRRPVLDGLELERAGIEHDRKGIKVDRRMRTSNRRVYAIGDCAGPYQFTHVANHHAGIVVRNMLLRLPASVDPRAFPWVTYTRPELAQVGLTEAEARERHAGVEVVRFPCSEIDRATAERERDGLLKVVATRRGRILGAGVVGARAGEIVQPWVLALSSGLGMGAMARMVAPYPSFGELNKRAAGAFFAPRVFGGGMRRLVRLLARLG